MLRDSVRDTHFKSQGMDRVGWRNYLGKVSFRENEHVLFTKFLWCIMEKTHRAGVSTGDLELEDKPMGKNLSWKLA